MGEEKGEAQYLRVFYFSRFIFKTFAVGPLLTVLVRKEKSNSTVKRVKKSGQKSHHHLEVG